MHPKHKYVRNILHSLCGLHKAGYGKIRFMLLVANGEYSIRIGPKRVFAKRDGLFIPQDLRHRSLLIPEVSSVFDADTVLGEMVVGGVVVEEGRSLIQRLRQILLGGNSDDRALDDGLWGRDPDYTKWLGNLTSFLDDFDFALPLRSEVEYVTEVPQPLRVDFLAQLNDRPLAPTITFELPPAGLLSVTPPPHYSNLEFAQHRAASAPNLLWDIRSRSVTDQAVDRAYEER